MQAMVAAIGAAVLFGVAVAIMPTAAYLPTAEEVTEFFVEGDRTLFVAAYLVAVAGVCVTWFAGRVRAVLGDAGGYSTIAFGGAVAAASAMALGFFIAVPAAQRAGAGQLSGSELVLAYDVFIVMLGNVANFGFAVLLGGLAMAGRESGRLPAWLVWSGGILALGLISPSQFALGPAALVWIVGAGVVLRKQPEREFEEAGT